jgi:hypothetical protein
MAQDGGKVVHCVPGLFPGGKAAGFSPNIVRVIKSRKMGWAGHIASMKERRGVCRVLVGKPEGKRPDGRPGRRWEDNIKMDFQEVG